MTGMACDEVESTPELYGSMETILLTEVSLIGWFRD